MVCHLKDCIKKKGGKDKEVHDNKIFNYFGNDIIASYLIFWNKNSKYYELVW